MFAACHGGEFGGIDAEISAIEPPTGLNDRDTEVRILGKNFWAIDRVVLLTSGGPVSLGMVKHESGAEMLVRVPAGIRPGDYRIALAMPEASRTYDTTFGVRGALPAVKSLDPPSARRDRAVTVAILGENFWSVSDVRLVGPASASLQGPAVDEPRSISAVVPGSILAGTSLPFSISNVGQKYQWAFT